MLASRQLAGVARGRVLGSASLGVRRMATVSDSTLDRKVSSLRDTHQFNGVEKHGDSG